MHLFNRDRPFCPRASWRPVRKTHAASFLLLLLTLAPLSAWAGPQAAALVIAERGGVLYAHSGSQILQRLGSEAELSVGDLVQTGPQGEVMLLFSDGSRVKIHANSRLRITVGTHTDHQENLFQALVGVFWAHLRPGQRIETPTANVVVRGTEVAVAVADDGTATLTVVEGEASFSNARGTVELSADQQSSAHPNQAPTPPLTVDASGLIAWTADLAGLPLEFETVGEGLTGAGSAAEADALESAAQKAPTDPVLQLRLGETRRHSGDLLGALTAFGQASLLSPNLNAPNAIEAHIGLALTYLSQNRVADARAALAPLPNAAIPLAVLGLADLQEGKGREAQAHLEAALAKYPRLAQARSLLALAYLTQNAVPEAEKAARAAVQQQPNSAQTEGTLSLVLFFAGENNEAVTAARQAVRLDPRSPFALLAQGRTLLAADQAESARTAYEKAAAVAPNLWLVHLELGTVYLRLDMPRKAAEECGLALRINPASAEAHTTLGLALQQQGRYAEAEVRLRQAIELSPGNVSAHGSLAALLIDRGRLGEARQELETGVRAAPQRGILYTRLAEISLYRQDLFGAQEFARRAVVLLPDSAVAHYTLGRVYLEQDRTVQAEQEFRQATTLDRQFAEARYALGLTEEKTEGGLLNAFSSLLGSALVGSPGSALTLENLQTPGAQQRIQAALMDPTVVRVASRSYGDTQLDAQIGEQGTRDLAGSYLADTTSRRGVRGVTAEEQATNGVRTNADQRSDRANFVYGQKAPDGPSGLFVTGEYEDSSQGLDTAIASYSFSAKERFHTHLARLISGFTLHSGSHGSLRGLVQISKSLLSSNDMAAADNYNRFDFRSLNGELRWDEDLSAANHLSAGLSLGSRHRQAFVSVPSPDPTLTSGQIITDVKLQPLQIYLRDEARLSPKLTLTGEMQVQRLDTFNTATFIGVPGLGTTQDNSRKTFGMPTVIAAYQADRRSAFRLRARRLFASVADFQLLTPTDVFLVSFAGLPQATSVGSSPSSDGTSVEAEYDRTFADASFLRIGAFQQDIRQGEIFNSGGGPYEKAHVRGVQASYEGLLGRELSFYLSGDINDPVDRAVNQRIAQVPNFDTLATLQYLNRAGFYAQGAFYYQGNRVTADGDPSQSGGFGVLNLRFGKRTGLRTNVYVALTNALNKSYDVYGLLQPARQFAVGISQRF